MQKKMYKIRFDSELHGNCLTGSWFTYSGKYICPNCRRKGSAWISNPFKDIKSGDRLKCVFCKSVFELNKHYNGDHLFILISKDQVYDEILSGWYKDVALDKCLLPNLLNNNYYASVKKLRFAIDRDIEDRVMNRKEVILDWTYIYSPYNNWGVNIQKELTNEDKH